MMYMQPPKTTCLVVRVCCYSESRLVYIHLRSLQSSYSWLGVKVHLLILSELYETCMCCGIDGHHLPP